MQKSRQNKQNNMRDTETFSVELKKLAKNSARDDADRIRLGKMLDRLMRSSDSTD